MASEVSSHNWLVKSAFIRLSSGCRLFEAKKPGWKFPDGPRKRIFSSSVVGVVHRLVASPSTPQPFA
jgi:hypothetical protein